MVKMTGRQGEGEMGGECLGSGERVSDGATKLNFVAPKHHLPCNHYQCLNRNSPCPPIPLSSCPLKARQT